MKKYFYFLSLATLLISCNNESCTDGLMNQNEDGIDCGGVCAACESCSDGIQNQNETGVDCGGVCSVCETCDDGIQNQDETGIDCGGVCQVCPITYDSTSTHGLNILYGSDSLFLNAATYSMQANVPEGGSLKIILYSINGGWGYTQPQNWTVGPQTSQQVFEVINPGNAIVGFDVSIFWGAEIVIQYFENSVSPTKQKYLKVL